MRRRTFAGAVVAAGAVAAAGLYRFTDLFVKHYPPTPYDDVLAQLPDRAHATQLGRKVGGAFDVPREAAQLRAQLQGATVDSAAQGDIATGRMTEVDGWIVPQVVARLSALAANV